MLILNPLMMRPILLLTIAFCCCVFSPGANAITAPTPIESIATGRLLGEAASSPASEISSRTNAKQERQKRKELKKAARRNRGDKSFVAAVLISFLFGYLGIDRFYLGYPVLGVLKLITLGGLGVWYWVDIILLATESLQPKNGVYYDMENEEDL